MEDHQQLHHPSVVCIYAQTEAKRHMTSTHAELLQFLLRLQKEILFEPSKFSLKIIRLSHAYLSTLKFELSGGFSACVFDACCIISSHIQYSTDQGF